MLYSIVLFCKVNIMYVDGKQNSFHYYNIFFLTFLIEFLTYFCYIGYSCKDISFFVYKNSSELYLEEKIYFLNLGGGVFPTKDNKL